MRSPQCNDVVPQTLALVAGQNGRCVTQRPKVGEIQIRWPIVEGIAGGPLDTKLESHVLSVRKIWRGLIAVTLEGYSSVVGDPRRNVPSPLQVGVEAVAAGRIEKTEWLRHIAVATLKCERVRQPVIIGDVTLNAQLDIVRVSRHRGLENIVVDQAGHIWLRKVTQQTPCDRVDPRLRNHISNERLARQGIVNAYGTAGLNALGEIPLPFQLSGNGFDGRVRVAIPSSKVVEEKECRRILDDSGDHERSAHGCAEPRLSIGGLVDI